MSDENAKVVGHNTDSGGETVGVWGEVDSEDGYGLATDDDVKVAGRIDTILTDLIVETGTTSSGDAQNVIMGHASNGVDEDVVGATIAGGGSDDGQAVFPNEVTGDYGTIGGGKDNTASDEAATVGGGFINDASGQGATVGGGEDNGAIGQKATVGGGEENAASAGHATVGGGNKNEASEFASTVGGGSENEATGVNATIAGGWGNGATRDGAVGGGAFNQVSDRFTTIGGGRNNTASGHGATVDGGRNNTASGDYATVGGGRWNEASGDYSFAAGREAKAIHDGASVWSDSNDETISSTGTDQFLIDAAGGVGIGTDDPVLALHVRPSSDHIGLVLQNSGSGSGTTDGGWGIGTGANTDNLNFYQTDTVSGAWDFRARITTDGEYEQISDARLKEGIESLDSVLADVCSLRPTRYRFRDSETASLGFIAQEVRELFPEMVTESSDDRGLLTLAYDQFAPLAIGAIQEQQKLIEDQEANLNEKDERIADLEEKTDCIDDLKAETDHLREELSDRDERMDELAAQNEALAERLAALEVTTTGGEPSTAD